MKRPLTTAQRSYIDFLLGKAEFDRKTVTVGYRLLNVSDIWIGKSVDLWMSQLSMEEGVTIIDNLKRLT